MPVQVAARRPLGDACSANRDSDENDGLKPLLLHKLGPDQGPDVSAIAAGAEQGIGCCVAAAAEIIEDMAASDKLIAKKRSNGNHRVTLTA